VVVVVVVLVVVVVGGGVDVGDDVSHAERDDILEHV